jgi:hypothetical protein
MLNFSPRSPPAVVGENKPMIATICTINVGATYTLVWH